VNPDLLGCIRQVVSTAILIVSQSLMNAIPSDFPPAKYFIPRFESIGGARNAWLIPALRLNDIHMRCLCVLDCAADDLEFFDGGLVWRISGFPLIVTAT
jgi:hypothetical protein